MLSVLPTGSGSAPGEQKRSRCETRKYRTVRLRINVTDCELQFLRLFSTSRHDVNRVVKTKGGWQAAGSVRAAEREPSAATIRTRSLNVRGNGSRPSVRRRHETRTETRLRRTESDSFDGDFRRIVAVLVALDRDAMDLPFLPAGRSLAERPRRDRDRRSELVSELRGARDRRNPFLPPSI